MPAVQLSYADSEEYCAWAVGLYGEKRLPTEYEWEYAARGGLQNQSYPWGEFKSKGSGRCNRVIKNDTCSKNQVTVNLIFGSDKGEGEGINERWRVRICDVHRYGFLLLEIQTINFILCTGWVGGKVWVILEEEERRNSDQLEIG